MIPFVAENLLGSEAAMKQAGPIITNAYLGYE